MPLYALGDRRGELVYRVGVSPSLDADIERLLREQSKSLTSADLDEVPFDGRLNADEAEVHVIEPFAEADRIIAAIASPLDLPLLQAADLPGIVGFGAQFNHAPNYLLLQAFDGRQVLASRGIAVLFTRDVLNRLTEAGFVIRDALDGVMDIGKRKLRFRQLGQMRRLFDMTEYYREATANDIRLFADLPEVIVDLGSLEQAADTWLRRKIALVMDTGILGTVGARRIAAHAKAFKIDLTVRRKAGRDCVVLPSDKKTLKNVLRLLDDDFLNSAITRRKYVTNSKRALSDI